MDLKNKGIAALVCGILAVISVFTGYGAIIGLVLGIVGIVLSVNVRKEMQQYDGDIDRDPALRELRGMSTAALICSIVGTAVAGIGFLCVACFLGTIGAAACAISG